MNGQDKPPLRPPPPLDVGSMFIGFAVAGLVGLGLYLAIPYSTNPHARPIPRVRR